MPKRSSRLNREGDLEDPDVTAFRVIQEATDDAGKPASVKNPAAVALGRLGGKKGGKARAAKLSPQERSEIARKAAEARWKRAGDDIS